MSQILYFSLIFSILKEILLICIRLENIIWKNPFRKLVTIFPIVHVKTTLIVLLEFIYIKLEQYESVNRINGAKNVNKSAEWIGDRNETLKGFSWKSGVKRHTTGVVFWSDVFLNTTKDGEKLAIILIDTQGLFDHDTPPAINAKIFTFTTLMSSYQIFNLPQLIQEDQLEYLQVFKIYE
jgi:hypothetical protein